MAKMKVHELAKELEIQSKEIITYLKEKGMEVKAAQSSIEDEAIALVRGHFKTGGKEPGKAAKETAAATEVPVERKAVQNTSAAEKTKMEKEDKAEKAGAGKGAPEKRPASENAKPERRRRSSSSIIPATAKCRETETATEMRTEAAETEGPRGSRDALRDRTVLRGTAQGRYPRRIPTGL